VVACYRTTQLLYESTEAQACKLWFSFPNYVPMELHPGRPATPHWSGTPRPE